MKSTVGFQRINWVWLFPFILLAGVVGSSRAADGAMRSKWDDNLLSVELGEVRIKPNTMLGAWQEMATKYLLRANLYMDAEAISDETTFSFRKKEATGKDVFDAFLAAYPAFTYTQSPETGVIWFHPKRVNYKDILSQQIRIAHRASQVPMYTGVYVPLLKLLAPKIIDSSATGKTGVEMDAATGERPIPYFWLYSVDLPAGVYTAREMLDFCCAANPTKAFLVRPLPARPQGPLVISLEALLYNNPLAPPRAEAVKFWELEIGKSTNGAPGIEEVRAAFADADPRKRSAAGLYLEAVLMTYSTLDLIGQAADPDQAVWTALGVEHSLWRDSDTNFFAHLEPRLPRLREDLAKVKNPGLALLALLQLTRENQDNSHLDEVVGKHAFSEAEITAIKPELDRMARSSQAVRDKLRAMKPPLPEFSSEQLTKLEQTNLFSLASPAGN